MNLILGDLVQQVFHWARDEKLCVHDMIIWYGPGVMIYPAADEKL